jgi:putative protease
MNRPARPEVLAPAGDPDALRAAIQAGADAVYFGLQGFNARARATNFDAASLRDTMDLLHAHGVRGYVTLNTLVFDAELPAVEAALRACAAAGVDAVIVQDLAVVRLARAIAPELPVHASTQMTCTDAGAVEFAAALGASRVILARELSLDDIAKIRAATDIPVEVFVHGALCVAYSGQCLTSEAIGGRSANRGACAQACRLPYSLVVDGEARDTGDRAFLLSPEDLEASALIPQLSALGVASVKIEGRLKADSYVAATTALYRRSVDAAAGDAAPPDEATRARALQMFTRGSGPGFLAGVDHQRLVDGSTCDHRGLRIATLRAVERMGGRTWLRLALDADLARGDGLLVQGARANEGEVGGRVWAITAGGLDVERAAAGSDARVWLGPERDASAAMVGHAVWRTNAPSEERAVRDAMQQATAGDVVDLVLRGRVGEPARLEAITRSGRRATVEGDAPIEAGRNGRTPDEVVRDKLGRLGGTTLRAGAITSELGPDAMVSPSSLNRLRRALVDALAARVTVPWATTDEGAGSLLASAVPPDRAPASAGLFVLCRTLPQAHAAIDAGADGVYLDFLELTGTGPAVRALRDRGVRHVALAPPRIRKPGEEKIDRYLASLAPDALLVRGLGALHESGSDDVPRIGDASLNVTNRITAATVLSRGLSSFTPSFDLDAAQVMALLESPFGAWSELVVHHPMPLFHMEHCVIAAELSTGRTHLDCGRPCERHRVSLRDRAGMEHPVEADVGCRNTVFHAAAQSAAGLVAGARRAGVRRYRIELVRETPEEVARIVDAYRRLLADQATAAEVWNTLKTEAHYGVVRGSLRVLAD